MYLRKFQLKSVMSIVAVADSKSIFRHFLVSVLRVQRIIINSVMSISLKILKRRRMKKQDNFILFSVYSWAGSYDFTYNCANGNLRSYWIVFPYWRQPRHRTFDAFYHSVAETGTLALQTIHRGKPRYARTPATKIILYSQEDLAFRTSHNTA